MADFCLAHLIALNLLMWTPYYLDTIGVKGYATILTINPIFFPLGSLFMEFLVSLCTACTKIITSVYVLGMMLFQVYWLFLPQGPESFIHYLIIFCMLDFFRGDPSSRNNGEVAQSVANDPFRKSAVFNFALLMK